MVENLRRDIKNGRLAYRYHAFDDLVTYGYYEPVRDLLEYAMSNGYSYEIKGLLKQAIENDNDVLVDIILDLDLDLNFYYPNLGVSNNVSPLDVAIRHNNPGLVRMLLKAGARATNRNDRGETALVVALGHPDQGTVAIVDLLMTHDADPSIADNNGDTAYSVLESHRSLFDDVIYQNILDLLNSHTDVKEPECT
jgi:ankyrin repeat protein